jgi:surface antigen
MLKTRFIPAVLTATLLLGGCATSSTPVNKEAAGAGVGAVTGALLGYGLGKGHSDKEAAIIVGALIGGIAGSKIGARLNEADRVLAGRALSDSLEYNAVGSASDWQNPDTGHSGYSTPTRTYNQNDGTPCREFTTVVEVGGQQEQAYGTACRQADGSWRIQS